MQVTTVFQFEYFKTVPKTISSSVKRQTAVVKPVFVFCRSIFCSASDSDENPDRKAYLIFSVMGWLKNAALSQIDLGFNVPIPPGLQRCVTLSGPGIQEVHGGSYAAKSNQ